MVESRGVESIWAGVTSLDRALAFFRDYVGMEVQSGASAPPELVRDLWGCPPSTAGRVATLINPLQKTLLRLVEFPPSAPGPVGRAGDATLKGIFNLGFLVRDVPALYQDLAAKGFSFLSRPVHYAPFGNFVDEVILIGPDGIPIVNLERPLPPGEAREKNYFKLNHSLLITADLARCRAFYGDILGLSIIRDTTLAAGAVDDILALPRGTGAALASFNNREMDHLALLCMRLSLPGPERVLRPPARGLFQLSFRVGHLDEILRQAAEAGFKQVSGPVEYAVPFLDRRRAALVSGPDGVQVELFSS